MTLWHGAPNVLIRPCTRFNNATKSSTDIYWQIFIVAPYLLTQM